MIVFEQITFCKSMKNNSKKNEKYSSLRIYLSNGAKIPVIYTHFNIPN